MNVLLRGFAETLDREVIEEKDRAVSQSLQNSRLGNPHSAAVHAGRVEAFEWIRVTLARVVKEIEEGGHDPEDIPDEEGEYLVED